MGYGDWTDRKKFGDPELLLLKDKFYQRANQAASVIGKKVRFAHPGEFPDIQVTFDTEDDELPETSGISYLRGQNDHGSTRSKIQMFLNHYELNNDGRLDVTSDEHIDVVFQHEFIHALGFRLHSKQELKPESSIMSAVTKFRNPEDVADVPDIDKNFLRTIYAMKEVCVPSAT